MGLEAGGRGGAEEAEEEKITHMCESIGHRPLWGPCPKSRNQRIKEENDQKQQ